MMLIAPVAPAQGVRAASSGAAPPPAVNDLPAGTLLGLHHTERCDRRPS